MSIDADNFDSYVRVDNVIDALLYLYENNELYKEKSVLDAIDALEFKLYNNPEPNAFGHHDININMENEDNVQHSVVMPIDYIVLNVNIREKLTGNRCSDRIPIFKMNKNVNYPLSVLNRNIHFEQLAFPWLFPDGVNGLNEKHAGGKTLSDLHYFPCRLESADTRFAKDLSYVFCNTI